MPRYVRAYVPGGTFFFTVALLDRDRRLLTEHVDALRDCFQSVRAQRPFDVEAIVILPEHLHCIWTLPQDDHDFSTRWRLIKGEFSKRIAFGEPIDRRRGVKAERGIWQRRFWEHTIRDESDLQAHIDYIHWNPVKHVHVQRVCDWPHSSFHRYVKRGLLPLDWGGSPDVRSMEKE